MKFSLTPLVALFLCAAASAFAADAGDALANWTYRAASDKENGYKLGVENQIPFLASRKPIQDPAKFYAAPFQEFSAAPYAGKRVRFSAELKADKVQGAAGLWFKVKGHDEVMAFDNMEQAPVRGTKDWHKYSLVLDVPKSADTLTVGVWLSGGGKLYFSDPALAAVDNTIAAHTKQWNAQKYDRFANELKKAPTFFDISESVPDDEQLRNWACHTSPSPSKCGIDRAEKLHGKPSAFIEQHTNERLKKIAIAQSKLDRSRHDLISVRMKLLP